MERVFKRKIYEKLLQWKEQRKGATALLIEGARRVGKSTIVKQFAQSEYNSYILIDFNNTTQAIRDLFDDLTDMNMFFMLLQQQTQVKLYERDSLIIFDEVQKFPIARQAIKYLVADGRYDFIETGSLISIKKNTKDITIPSEETRISMFPMDYDEFRWALADEVTPDLLPQFYQKGIPLGPTHRKAMRDFRLYMLVGGMPQAVNAYLDTNNLSDVDQVKRDIIKLYLDDFRKIDPTGRVEKLFLNIPAQLSNNVSRYMPYQAIGEVKGDKMLEFLNDLEDSKTVLMCYRCNDPNVGMSLTQDQERYKMFLADTGLFVTLAFWDKDVTENIIYSKLLNDKLQTNLGYIYENIVAQTIVATGQKLFYYTFPSEDGKRLYEVDFLLSKESKLWPLEVKSSGYKTHQSLDEFCSKYPSRVSKRFLITTKDYEQQQQTTILPVYMTSLLK
ncbi:MAG: ATP-binding protein [Paludibacteraceae bacterium]|nr:ATP-binding protein [Paludibacteraceae bacterium]